jgi:sortase A
VWEVADFAAGWHQNSATPGDGGNVVISGHHNIKGEVFRYIVDLNPGDVITLYADGQPLDYSVESRLLVEDKGVSGEQRRENARWIGSFPGERLTLITCWPYSNNTHRVIVVARPVSDVELVDEGTVDGELDGGVLEDVAGHGRETESVKRDA